MAQIIADLQLHSKYSRAVSPEMVIPRMFEWNLKKGIGLLATGDWTHPLWVRELKINLEEQGNGLLKLKKEVREKLVDNELARKMIHNDPLFLLSGEVSCIYSHNGKLRRNHLMLWAQSFATVDKINAELTRRGCNISSDGRPILGLSSQEICELVWSLDPEVLVVPAHVWTPWFSLFGSMSGYDSLEECFGQFTDRIYAVETGLSSDPAMNWRIKELDTRSIVSSSDAHSGPKLMREATIYDIPASYQLSFGAISQALKNYRKDTSLPHISATIEFYPEEGKYHFSGHRACSIRWSPQDVKEKGTICPVCGKPITIGVLNRVEKLAERTEEELKLIKKQVGNTHVSATYSESFPNRPPYIMMVPLAEIIAEVMGVQSFSVKVRLEYDKLVTHFGGEFNVLVKVGEEEIAGVSGSSLSDAIGKVRNGNITIIPGYDGVFGTVQIESKVAETVIDQKEKEQMSLF
ncbi:MAG: endonuclease Q family protein [Patescibacteria group bacterium]